jgi:hypothetical protein
MDEETDYGALFAPYLPYHVQMLMGDPAESAQLLAALADEAPDDDHLDALATSLIEAFLGAHGEAAYSHFEAALRSSQNLRKAWSCAWSAVPDEWERRFSDLLEEGEDIGGPDE